MKLKKSGFVNIIEKPHKLSQKFSLATVKSRKPDKKDLKIVQEILNFCSHLKTNYKSFGGEWEYLNIVKRKKYINALFDRDLDKLASFFSNLFREDASYGIVTPSFSDIKNDLKFKSQILQDIDASIEFSNLDNSKQLEINKNIGNPFGIKIKDNIIMPDTPRHFYFANKIKKYSKFFKKFKFLEIGGGYGGLARILHSLNKKITYFSIDLLEGCLIQYYFLKKCGFKVNLIKNKGDIRQNQINLIIFDKNLDMLKNIGKCDFVFNSRSFSEMSKEILNKYLSFINNKIKPEYIYHENSNFLLFPKSKRHIEILGDEFKIDKKKYNLEYINISPFSGGSGRYREFFYKKT